MIDYLIVILEHNCVSFCCYDVKDRNRNEPISLDLLKKIVNYAIRDRLSVNFLYGGTPLPPEYEKVIAVVEHMKMMPLSHAGSYENTVFIIDGEEDLRHVRVLDGGDLNNVILRVGRDDLGSLGATVKSLIGRFKRLNVIIKDVHRFTEEAFSVYERQLEDVGVIVGEEYRKGNFIEVNVLSDRVFLTNMNNCNAGTRHLTVAPNGRFYVCPAFYYENDENSLGDLDDRVEIKNARLLELEYAPICRNCDAWHCRRCVWLNDALTSELNTPSHQQCVLAHLEREASRKFLERVGADIGINDRVAPIPKLDYLDPFDIITNRSVSPEDRERHFAQLLSKPLEDLPVTELLRQIYRTDPKMLTRLKEQNCAVVDLEDKG
ncbi:MAG: CXXX repeat peptide maturase [Syntrophorhabdaceae bacterium]|nr:CXXX repeat peptide maturase [Syntrophorhabdaceae bacterium]